MSLLGAAGIGAASSLFGTVGSLFNSGKQYERQKDLLKMQQKYSTQAATTAYDRQLEFWNMQNAYNTPSAQRGRLESAGLNPALMYSGSGASTPAQGLSSVPQADGGSAPQAPRAEWANPFDEALKLAQLKVAESTANLNNANADKARGDTKDADETLRGQVLENNIRELKIVSVGLANESQRIDNDFRKLANPLELKHKEQTIANLNQQIKESDERIASMLSQRDLNDASRKELLSRVLLNHAQMRLVQSNIDLNSTQADKFVAEITNIEKLRGLIDKQIETEGATADLREAQAMLQKFENGAYFDESGNSSWQSELVRDLGAIISRFSPLKFK